MKQQWRYIPGFKNYLVSNDGQIFTLPGKNNKNGLVMTPRITQVGYAQYTLVNDNGEKKEIYAHRAVALTWIPRKQNQKDCNVVMHLDDNPLNNHMDNLKWGTSFMNMRGVAEKAIKKSKREPTEVSAQKVFELLRKNKDFDGRKTELIKLIADELDLSSTYVNIIIYTLSYKYPHLREQYKDVLKERKKK